MRPSTSPFGPSPLPPRPAHRRLVQFSQVLLQHEELERCCSPASPSFRWGFRARKTAQPPLYFNFSGEVGGCFCPTIYVLRTKRGESVTLLLAPFPLLSDPLVRDRWLLSLHQRSSPETPAFPRQSGNRTQRLALAHLHV